MWRYQGVMREFVGFCRGYEGSHGALNLHDNNMGPNFNRDCLLSAVWIFRVPFLGNGAASDCYDMCLRW